MSYLVPVDSLTYPAQLKICPLPMNHLSMGNPKGFPAHSQSKVMIKDNSAKLHTINNRIALEHYFFPPTIVVFFLQYLENAELQCANIWI